jgi:cyclin H
MLTSQATAVQYIKRFYLTNSVMSYHPRSIMLTALFLATKIESRLMPARDMAHILHKLPSLENITADEIVAAEFVLTQGLLFNLDVRHPSRGLKGAYIEFQMLLAIMKSKDLPKGLEKLKSPQGGNIKDYLKSKYTDAEKFAKRTHRAYGLANNTLKNEAVLSDAYFLYTPSQIVLAALLVADEELALDLYHIRMSRESSDEKLLQIVKSCMAEMKKATGSWRETLPKAARSIDRKLHFCRNPEKADLVERHKAQKRDAAGADGKLDEAVAKKRKLERERVEKEGNDLFGPALK